MFRCAAPSTIASPNPAYAALRATLAEKEAQASSAAARRGQLQADMAALTARQADEPGVVAEQERLARDYDVLKRQYDKLLEDRERTRLRSDVASKSEALRFQVIDPPSRATAPACPNRPLLLTAVLLLGLGAGVRYVGESWGDTANTRSVDDYVIADLALRYAWDGFIARLGVTNLFDEQYYATCDAYFGCILGEGRETTLTLSKAF